MVSRDEIRAVLDSCKSNRAKRTSERARLIAETPSAAPKPKKQKAPSITPGSCTPAKRGHGDDDPQFW